MRLLRGSITIVFISLILVPVNVSQVLSLVVLPFSRPWFTRINMHIKHFYCSLAARAAVFCGNKLITTGDLPRQENCIIFANHQSMSDVLLIWLWCLPSDTVSRLTWFAKEPLKNLPGIGWGLRFVNTVFVKRDWARDADTIRATFAKIRDGNLPASLVIFPEGTRMKPDKFAASQAYAKRKGLPVLNHVLLPRGKGVHASLQGLEGHLQAVYDLTIIYEGVAPTIAQMFLHGGYTIRFHAVRYDIKAVPSRERDLNAWLMNIFIEKDKLMAEAARAAGRQ
jgi:1-acyl-sn-glycerol-3-phosphate acyltransferase